MPERTTPPQPTFDIWFMMRCGGWSESCVAAELILPPDQPSNAMVVVLPRLHPRGMRIVALRLATCPHISAGKIALPNIGSPGGDAGQKRPDRRRSARLALAFQLRASLAVVGAGQPEAATSRTEPWRRQSGPLLLATPLVSRDVCVGAALVGQDDESGATSEPRIAQPRRHWRRRASGSRGGRRQRPEALRAWILGRHGAGAAETSPSTRSSAETVLVSFYRGSSVGIPGEISDQSCVGGGGGRCGARRYCSSRCCRPLSVSRIAICLVCFPLCWHARAIWWRITARQHPSLQFLKVAVTACISRPDIIAESMQMSDVGREVLAKGGMSKAFDCTRLGEAWGRHTNGDLRRTIGSWC